MQGAYNLPKDFKRKLFIECAIVQEEYYVCFRTYKDLKR